MLRHCLPPNVRQALRSLPESLDETYEGVLKKIAEAQRPQAHLLLQCLIAAIRPLHVEELAEVLALDFDRTQDGIPKLNEGWRLWDDPELTVLSMCPSLIDIVDDHSSNTRVVKFAHSSVEEFLASDHFYVSSESAHTIVAQACLGILLQLGDDEPAGSRSPLAVYAARHWVDHAQFEDVASRIQYGMQRLFDPYEPHFIAWLQLHDVDDGWNLFGGHSIAKHHGTPLYYASLCGFRDLAAHLIAMYPQDVNTRGGLNHSPLVAALHKRNFDIAEMLYDHGAALDVEGLDQQTPLHAASLGGLTDIVDWLLAHGADPNSRDGLSDSTPLHWAAANGHIKVVRMLLGRSAKANVVNKDRHTPLHLASNFGYFEIVRLLLENGANVDAKEFGHLTPLQITLFGGQNKEIPTPSGVFSTRDDGRPTPLHLASSGGHIDTVRLLIEHAADVNAQDERNSTPLHFASSKGQTETVQLLIDRGGDIHARDESHSTPLHLASSTGSIEAVRILIDHGADIDAEDDDGQTPYRVAQSGRHPNHGLITQLLSYHC